ncbi:MULTISPECIES: TetR/AcrR family transcriptional regulator [Noviherbaspirillum]|uniref:TetR/AcrR family transcriptional regulator n=1 Tax=Noviherbaspirillum TaxID=1344552 RepID=UPI00124DE681|nr:MULTISPECIES: TetR/AcrR family transcriptional regulator [Noviherbaspirillum]
MSPENTTALINPTPGTQTPVQSGDQTRDQILHAAASLFRNQGYAATTLRQIADAAGIKAGSIYYHFSSKDEILGVVLDAGIDVVMKTVREKIEALPPTATYREKIATGIEGHLYGLLHHGDFTSANIRVYGQIPHAAKNKHRIIRRAYADYWDKLFAEALTSGELRSDTSVAVVRLFVIGALNWTVEWYNPQRGSFKAFAQQITGIVFDGILNQDNR